MSKGTIMFKGVDYSSAGGGSQPIEITKEEYDALGDEKLTDNKLYFIKDYAESYAMNGKGMVSKVLWEGVSTSASTVELNDSITDYDLIGIIITADGNNAKSNNIFTVQDILETDNLWGMLISTYSGTGHYASAYCYFPTVNTFQHTDLAKVGWNNACLTKIIGLKFCAATACYSTDEQIVGRWIDGKPLYQKTIIREIDTIEHSEDISGWNIDMLVDIRGTAKSSEHMRPILHQYANGANTAESTTVWIDYANQTLRWHSLATWSSPNYPYIGTGYITLQYTKTTD